MHYLLSDAKAKHVAAQAVKEEIRVVLSKTARDICLPSVISDKRQLWLQLRADIIGSKRASLAHSILQAPHPVLFIQAHILHC